MWHKWVLCLVAIVQCACRIFQGGLKDGSINVMNCCMFQTGLAVGDVQEIRDNATVEQLAKRVSKRHKLAHKM